MNAHVAIVLFFVTPHALLAQPSWDDRLDFNDCTRRLATEPIKTNTGLGLFFEQTKKRGAKAGNKMRLIELESGLQAVFKPGEYCYAEVAAYKASNALGLRLVPPTVLRTIDGKTGSLQFYIDSPINVSEAPERFFQRVHPKIISDMKIFYFVFGQWDIHAGNQVIHPSRGKLFLALIDNAGMLHRQHVRYGHRPFIERGGERTGLPCIDAPTFPFDAAQTINSSSHSKLRKILGAVIPQQISHLMQDSHDVRYVFWRNTLWIEVKHSLGKIEKFSASTLRSLKALNAEVLKDVWAEWYAVEPRHADQLIALTLERRDTLVTIAESSGAIF